MKSFFLDFLSTMHLALGEVTSVIVNSSKESWLGIMNLVPLPFETYYLITKCGIICFFFIEVIYFEMKNFLDGG